jgi:signal transduction histidine kinase
MDIHDSSLQSLAAAAYGAGNALAFLSAGRTREARAVIETARDAIDDAIKQLRASIVDLRRSVVEEGGLLETVRHYCDQIGTLWGTDVRIEGQIRHEPPDPCRACGLPDPAARSSTLSIRRPPPRANANLKK